MPSFIFSDWLSHYGYWALFLLAIFEGPIITIVAGFFVSINIFYLPLAYFVVVAGDLVGDSLHYAIGRWGGRHFITKWGRWFGLSLKQIEPLERNIHQHANRWLFFGKILHGVGGALLVAAGLVHLPFRIFIFSNFWATLLKSALLLAIGFFFGAAISRISSILNAIALGVITLTLIFIATYFFYRRSNHNHA